MAAHAQSTSRLTSHFLLDEPPHGPFSMLLAHREIGHIPPVVWMMQLPHPTHFSDHNPCSSGTPNMPVFSPGKHRCSGYMSPIVWAPSEHAIDSTRSEESIFSSTSFTHSFSHCLSTTRPSSSCFRPCFLFLIFSAETSILTS